MTTDQHDTSDRRCSCGELLTCLAATPAPLDDDDGWQERGNPGEPVYRCDPTCACGCHDTFGQPARFERACPSCGHDGLPPLVCERCGHRWYATCSAESDQQVLATPLDVERLARALHAVEPYAGENNCEVNYHADDAAAIAAAYAEEPT